MCASEVLAGITHGDWCPYGFDAEMPSDQREEDGRGLVFDSPALRRRTSILGAPVVDLRLSCNVPQAQLYVRLCDVAPDGASTRVTYGVLNLSHRNGHETPEPLEPGARTSVRVQLNDCGHVFPLRATASALPSRQARGRWCGLRRRRQSCRLSPRQARSRFR